MRRELSAAVVPLHVRAHADEASRRAALWPSIRSELIKGGNLVIVGANASSRGEKMPQPLEEMRRQVWRPRRASPAVFTAIRQLGALGKGLLLRSGNKEVTFQPREHALHQENERAVNLAVAGQSCSKSKSKSKSKKKYRYRQSPLAESFG
jgi:hypothetical protein